MNIIKEYIPYIQKEEKNVKVNITDIDDMNHMNNEKDYSFTNCTSELVHQIEQTEHNLNNFHTINKNETADILNESMEEVLTNCKLIIEKTINKKVLDNEDITDMNNQCKFLSSLNNIYINIKHG